MVLFISSGGGQRRLGSFGLNYFFGLNTYTIIAFRTSITANLAVERGFCQCKHLRSIFVALIARWSPWHKILLLSAHGNRVGASNDQHLFISLSLAKFRAIVLSIAFLRGCDTATSQRIIPNFWCLSHIFSIKVTCTGNCVTSCPYWSMIVLVLKNRLLLLCTEVMASTAFHSARPVTTTKTCKTIHPFFLIWLLLPTIHVIVHSIAPFFFLVFP